MSRQPGIPGLQAGEEVNGPYSKSTAPFLEPLLLKANKTLAAKS